MVALQCESNAPIVFWEVRSLFRCFLLKIDFQCDALNLYQDFLARESTPMHVFERWIFSLILLELFWACIFLFKADPFQ